MKRSIAMACAMAAAFGLVAPVASAQGVPQTMSFAARIHDGDAPVTGAVELVFEIFGTAEGGTSLWSEQQQAQADSGLVHAILGAKAGNGLDAVVFDGSPRFLQLSVNGDVQSPRIAILSVPYATRAAVASTLGSLGEDDVVTGVIAGEGLSGGGAGGDVTVAVDTELVQRRVSGSCESGKSIQRINADGSVVCHVDGAPGTFIVQVNAMTCAHESGTPTIEMCSGSGHVRTDGDSSYPCAVRSASSVRDTYMCNLNLPDGALLEEIVVHCDDSSNGGYCEGAVWRSHWTEFTSVPVPSGTTTIWYNSGVTAMPGGISFPIYVGAPHTMDTDVRRYLVGLGVKAPSGYVRLYGFHVRYRIP